MSTLFERRDRLIEVFERHESGYGSILVHYTPYWLAYTLRELPEEKIEQLRELDESVNVRIKFLGEESVNYRTSRRSTWKYLISREIEIKVNHSSLGESEAKELLRKIEDILEILR